MKLDAGLIRSSRVMVVGCGALGNEVLKNLALSGVGHIVCVDFDTVEEGNLTRSVLFRRSDAALKRRKTEVVAGRLRELDPDIDVRTIDGDAAFDVGLGVFAEMDAVVGCVDSRWARFMINRHCMRTGRPWVDGGITQWEGSARVFVPGRNCYACNLSTDQMNDLRRRMPCSNVIRRAVQEGSVPTSVMLASVIGAVQAQETLKLLCGVGSSNAGGASVPDGAEGLCGRMFSYQGDVVKALTAEYAAFDEDCPEHRSWLPAEQTSFTVSTTVDQLFAALPAGSELLLRDDCFVDYVQSRSDGSRHTMMLPGRRVAEAVASSESLSAMPDSAFYQNEYRRIGPLFPYRDLTLSQLGIPPHDILEVSCGGMLRHYIMEDEAL